MAKGDKLFDRICEIAERGERCPTNEHLPPNGLSDLAREGRIRIEIFDRNWRIVTILVGAHAGKSTMRGPHIRPDAKPYVTIDAGSPPRRATIPADQRREPWKPGTRRP